MRRSNVEVGRGARRRRCYDARFVSRPETLAGVSLVGLLDSGVESAIGGPALGAMAPAILAGVDVLSRFESMCRTGWSRSCRRALDDAGERSPSAGVFQRPR